MRLTGNHDLISFFDAWHAPFYRVKAAVMNGPVTGSAFDSAKVAAADIEILRFHAIIRK
jgi:hypothetical protein